MRQNFVVHSEQWDFFFYNISDDIALYIWEGRITYEVPNYRKKH